MENEKKQLVINIYHNRYLLFLVHTLLLAFLYYIILPIAPVSILMIPILLIMIWCNIMSFILFVIISYDLTVKFIKYIINKTDGEFK